MATQPTAFSERVRTLNFTPLVKSDNPIFTDWYTFGLGYRLFGQQTGDGSSDEDASLLTTFQQCRQLCYFEREYEHALSRTLGLVLGMIHGGVLLSDGTVRRDTTTLVTLTHQETLRGYHAGREFFFLDADEEEDWHLSEIRLVEWLRELADEYTRYEEPLGTVRFAIGTILGELSGHLFLWTDEEQQAYEAESISMLGYVGTLNPACLVARQFAVEAVS